MNREEAKRYAPILKAYAEGKTVERKYRKPGNKWEKVDDSLSFENDFVYRLKEPTYRPFKSADECLEEMDKHTGKGYVSYGPALHSVVRIDCHGIMLVTYGLNPYPTTILLSFKEAMQMNVRFMDTCPFGMAEDEE